MTNPDKHIENIFPLVVPARYYVKGTWELPHYFFPNKNYILTRVFFTSETAMSYITQQDVTELDIEHRNWRQSAFENLRNSPLQNSWFYNEYKVRESDGKLLFIVFLNEDGIGSSRVLLSEELSKAFPNGYLISIPDRTCGVAIAKDISEKELKEVESYLIEMYDNGGTKMSKQIFSPSEFALPENWITPIDRSLSSEIVQQIIDFNPG